MLSSVPMSGIKVKYKRNMRHCEATLLSQAWVEDHCQLGVMLLWTVAGAI